MTRIFFPVTTAPISNGGAKEIRLSKLAISDGDLQMHSANRGTDNTAAIQAALNTGGANLRVIVDGQFASKQLKIKSGTMLEADSMSSGLVQLAGDNRSFIVNANRRGAAGAFNIVDQDIIIRGGTYNGNGHTATGVENRLYYNPENTEGWATIFNFRGVDDLELSNVRLLNSRTLGCYIQNAKNVVVNGYRYLVSPSIPVAGGTQMQRFCHDALKMGGPFSNAFISKLSGRAVDDFFSFCANDGYKNQIGWVNGSVNTFDPFAGYGAISDVKMSDVHMENCLYGGRLLSITERISRVSISRVSGSVTDHALLCHQFDVNSCYAPAGAPSAGYYGALTFEDWNLNYIAAGTDGTALAAMYFSGEFDKVTLNDTFIDRADTSQPALLFAPTAVIKHLHVNNLTVPDTGATPLAAVSILGAALRKTGDLFGQASAGSNGTTSQFVQEDAAASLIQFTGNWVQSASAKALGGSLKYLTPADAGTITLNSPGNVIGFKLWAPVDTSPSKSTFNLVINNGSFITVTQVVANPDGSPNSFPYYTSPVTAAGPSTVTMSFASKADVYPIFDAIEWLISA